jgi:hypothetical protein
MAQTPALFIAHVGAAGFMPDSSFGPYECATRGELVATVDSVLAALQMSGRSRRQVDLVAVWRAIQRQGNGRAGFIIDDGVTRTRVHFHNMTPGEAEEYDDD